MRTVTCPECGNTESIPEEDLEEDEEYEQYENDVGRFALRSLFSIFGDDGGKFAEDFVYGNSKRRRKSITCSECGYSISY